MEIFIIWILLAAGVGWLAASRGRSGFGFFLLSALLSPLLGLIVVLVIKDLNVEAEQAARRVAEELRAEKRRREEHETQIESIRVLARSTAQPSSSLNAEEKLCPFCAETIKAAAIKCKHCGSDLPMDHTTAPARAASVSEPASPAVLDGVCPNCARAVALDALSCGSCDAQFDPGAAWNPRRRQLGEVVEPPLVKPAPSIARRIERH